MSDCGEVFKKGWGRERLFYLCLKWADLSLFEYRWQGINRKAEEWETREGADGQQSETSKEEAERERTSGRPHLGQKQDLSHVSEREEGRRQGDNG